MVWPPGLCPGLEGELASQSGVARRLSDPTEGHWPRDLLLSVPSTPQRRGFEGKFSFLMYSLKKVAT